MSLEFTDETVEAASSSPPDSVEIDGPTKTCADCSQSFPKNDHYFEVSKKSAAGKQYFRAYCWECGYQRRVAAGAKPIYPAKNGVSQKEYHSQLREADKQTKAAKPKEDIRPWLQKTLNPRPEPPIGPAPHPDAGKKMSVFDLNPSVKMLDHMHYELTINDYFAGQQSNYRKVPVQTPGPGQPQANYSTYSTDEAASEDEEDEEGDEELDSDDEEDEEGKPYDPRGELHKSIHTWPEIARKLNLTHETVHGLSDLECHQQYEVFRAIRGVSSYVGVLHQGVKLAADAIDGALTGTRISEERTIDLTGYSEALDTPEIEGCLGELAAEHEAELSEVLKPEYKLCLLMLLKAHEVDKRNHREKLISRTVKNGFIEDARRGRA